MKVLVIGVGGERESFAQLRTWSLSRWLTQQGIDTKQILLHPEDHSHSPELLARIQDLAQHCTAAVTCGPYHPALVLDILPENLPVWVDWPSDPLVDEHAKKLAGAASPQSTLAARLCSRIALERADAIGVISHRQKWLTTGQLLSIDRDSVPVEVVPVAYDFPAQQLQPQRKEAVLLSAGSANTWFDLSELTKAMKQSPNLSLHLTGGIIPEHYPQARALVDDIARLSNVTAHGWLDKTELQSIVQGSRCGVWIDRPGLEPLLGSRTRALFYAWHGLPSIASINCELSEWMHKEGLLLEWRTDHLPELVEQSRNIESARLRQLCEATFNPDACYEPVMQWLRNPERRPAPKNDPISQELLELRRALRNIYETPTWRYLSRAHQLTKSIRSLLESSADI